MALVVGAEDERSSRADFTACFTAKTARTQRGTARKRRLPGTGCLGHNPPTTKELSHIHINTTSHNHTTTAPLSTHLTTHTSTTRRYKSYHPHSRLCTRISQTSTTQITPSTKTGRLRRSAVSRSHSHDHRGVQRQLRQEATEVGPLPKHQPRHRHWSSRANEVVPCAADLRRLRC
jgi:hypothetical protein